MRLAGAAASGERGSWLSGNRERRDEKKRPLTGGLEGGRRGGCPDARDGEIIVDDGAGGEAGPAVGR